MKVASLCSGVQGSARDGGVVVLQVVLVSACSGHGYKFTSVIGEIAKDLALTGETRHDVDRFKMRRARQGMQEVLERFGK